MADSKYTESGGRLKKAAPVLIRLRNIFVSSACVGLLFFGLAWGAHFFLRYLKYEITNDAYIDQYVVPLSVRVSGNIKDVRFREHMKVKKGELLLTIDDREFKMRVASAKAALAEAQANAEMLESDIESAKYNMEAAEAGVEEAKMRHVHLLGNAERFRELIKDNAVSGSLKEEAESDLAANSARIKALEAQKKTYAAQLSALLVRRKSLKAAVEMRRAELGLAELDLEYTQVRAPYDGVMGRRTVEPGEFVQNGQTFTMFSDSANKWVTANYKETQISSIYVGQKVAIRVDAFPDYRLKGIVRAISAATGSKYSLVPTDNSAGNFVKIRQRIPVRIEFDGVPESVLDALGAGMMVEVDAER